MISYQLKNEIERLYVPILHMEPTIAVIDVMLMR